MALIVHYPLDKGLGCSNLLNVALIVPAELKSAIKSVLASDRHVEILSVGTFAVYSISSSFPPFTGPSNTVTQPGLGLVVEASVAQKILKMRIPFRKHLSLSPSSDPSSMEPDMENNATVTSNTSALSHQIPPRLLKFQQLVGICSPNVLRANPTLARPAQNEGIYKRTVDEESRIKFQYSVSNYMVNVFFMLQIIVGAALTALGAAKGPPSAVTFLGAVNTVVAGLLTYLKGQGLPMRLEQYLHLLRTLREHIEAREREFLEPDCPLDVDEEIDRVTKMYQEVRQTAQDNAPGTVLPPRGSITTLLKKPDINRSDVPVPRGDKTPGDMLKTGLQDLATLRHHASDSVEEKGEGYMTKANEGTKDVESEMERLGHVAKDTIDKLSGGSVHGRHAHGRHAHEEVDIH